MSLMAASKVYKPFLYPWAVAFTIEHEKLHWAEHEAKLQDDVAQWYTQLNVSEKNHITQILRLFTQSDVEVGTNYLEHYIQTFKNNQIRGMLTSFANREFIHQRAYALLNETLGLPEEEFSAFLAVPEMAEKLEFMGEIKMDSPHEIGLAIARSVMNEGMSLFSAFVMLLNYQRFGKMKGMCEIVEWSIRDETMHTEGMVKLFRTYCDENPEIVNDEFKTCIYQMFRDGCELEDQVIDLAFTLDDVEGLTADEVKRYIRFIANRRLTQLGLKPNWEEITKNPLPWLDWVLNATRHTNFFEGVVTDYNNEGAKGDWGW